MDRRGRWIGRSDGWEGRMDWRIGWIDGSDGSTDRMDRGRGVNGSAGRMNRRV